MAFFLAVGIGLMAWPVVSHTYPILIPQTPFDTSYARQLTKDSRIITPQLSTFIEKTVVLENITGLSIAVVSKYGEPEFHTWGHRTEDGDEVTPDTLFYMASVSKAFCATALGLLIDDFANGNNVTALPSRLTELTWRSRLSDLLPDWQLMDEWASERANLRDILSHVSGLPRHDASYGPSVTPQDMIMRLRHLRPAFELREQFSYGSILYMAAAHVIATYAGQPYTSFVEERIFAPLGMTSTTFSPDKAEVSGKLTQGWTKEGRRVPGYFTEDMAFGMAGPGGIISNAIDMAKWISAWIGEGVHDNQTIIPPSVYRNVSYAYAVSISVPPDPEYSIVGYGMGWFRRSYRGHDIVYHSGALPWLSTLVSFLPTDETGVILFANGKAKAEPLLLIQNRILDAALGLTSPLTPASPSSPEVTQMESSAQNLAISLDALAGTYANPGYGSFTLCGPSSVSSYCARVQSDFSAVDGAQGHVGSKDVLAEWPRMWSSHVRLRHLQGAIFEISFTSLYPDGYGKDATPFEAIRAEGLAEFVIEEGEVVGFGMSGFVDRLTERARKHERVQDRAEVWFDKACYGEMLGLGDGRGLM